VGNVFSLEGNIFLSVRDDEKNKIVNLAKRLVDLGFTIYATQGTSTVLTNNGIRTNAVFKISTGRPNVLDLMNDNQLSWIINTPSPGPTPMVDEIRMRAESVFKGIPITTTYNGLAAAVDGLEALRKMKSMEICSLQEYHRHSVKLKL